MKIPVIGVPILTGQSLLEEMLDTIDVEVGEIVVIDNGDIIKDLDGCTVIKPGRNLGVAASWNHIMAIRPEAAWWAMIGYDVTFAHGDLTRLVVHMEQVGGLGLLAGFSAFGIDHTALDLAGTFDENFHPAYFEDNDYDRRCQLAGVPLHGLPAGLLHRVSSTINNNVVYRTENSRTFPYNAAYYRQKWGGTPRQEQYDTPFDEGGSVKEWTLDEDRLAIQAWSRA